MRFFINGLCLLLVWVLFYKLLRPTEPVRKIYDPMVIAATNSWLNSSSAFLDMLGYDARVAKKKRLVKVFDEEGNYRASVQLLEGCLGRELLGVLIGLVLAYPGNWVRKLWFIPASVAFFYLLNMLRISLLALAIYYYPESYTRYNHHAIFNIVIYVVIFFTWVLWVRKIRNSPKPEAVKS